VLTLHHALIYILKSIYREIFDSTYDYNPEVDPGLHFLQIQFNISLCVSLNTGVPLIGLHGG